MMKQMFKLLSVCCCGILLSSPQKCPAEIVVTYLGGGATVWANNVVTGPRVDEHGSGINGQVTAISPGSHASALWDINTHGAYVRARVDVDYAGNAGTTGEIHFAVSGSGPIRYRSSREQKSSLGSYPSYTQFATGTGYPSASAIGWWLPGIGYGNFWEYSMSIVWTDEPFFPGETEEHEFKGVKPTGKPRSLYDERHPIDGDVDWAEEEILGYQFMATVPIQGSYGQTSPFYMQVVDQGSSIDANNRLGFATTNAFTSLVIPNSSDIYQLELGGTLYELAGGDTFDFTDLYPGGATNFRMWSTTGSDFFPSVVGFRFAEEGPTTIVHSQFMIPEPSSLVTATLAAVILGLVGWRRTRTRRPWSTSL